MTESATRKRLVLVVVGLLAGIAGVVLGFLATRGFPGGEPQASSVTVEEIGVGATVPDFRLADLDGRQTSFSTLSGKPAVVNFWATWCPPCLREMPLLQALHEQGEVLVLGINAGEPIEVVEAYLHSRELDYPVWTDPPGTTPLGRSSMDLFRRFGGIGLPLTLFVDAGGILRATHSGELDTSILRQRLAEILPSS